MECNNNKFREAYAAQAASRALCKNSQWYSQTKWRICWTDVTGANISETVQDRRTVNALIESDIWPIELCHYQWPWEISFCLKISVAFLSRVSTLTRDIDIANLSVRLSVHLSVSPSVRDVPVSDENGLTYCHGFFSPYGSSIILVLPASDIFTKFRRGHLLRGRQIQVGYKNFSIFYQ